MYLLKDQDDEVLDVDPISWYFDPNNNNDNITGDLVSTIPQRNKVIYIFLYMLNHYSNINIF